MITRGVTPYTNKWIFNDLMPGDKFKCIKGKMCGTRMTIKSIDYKKHKVVLTYYAGVSFGTRDLEYSEAEFNEYFNFVAWHS